MAAETRRRMRSRQGLKAKPSIVSTTCCLSMLFFATTCSAFAAKRTGNALATIGIQRAHRHSSFSPSRISLTTQISSLLTASETDADVVDLKYTEYSSPEASQSKLPPAIIMHGLLGSKRNFASLASSLSAQLQNKRRILSIDLRNHGDNDPESWREDMSYGTMAKDVMRVLDREGLREAVLIGHSMGGKVAKASALLYPERVAGLVVMDIAPVTYSCSEPHWGSVKETIDSIAAVSLQECESKRDVDVQLRSAIGDPALRAFVLTNLDQCRKTGVLRWKINVEAITKQLDTIAAFDIAQPDGVELTEGALVYNGDTLFIKGGASKFVQNSHVDTISSYFPNYLLTSIRSAGHWIHAEAPEPTLAMLKRYLDR